MLEMIGLAIGLLLLFGLCVVSGLALGVIAWVFFWGHRRPKFLTLAFALTPLASGVYAVIVAFCMELLVPHNPDYFFGDISEPLPNGYLLTGIGKMPEFSYIDSTPTMMHQPPLKGGIRRLELDHEVVYGAYGHLDSETNVQNDQDHGYFAFDTRTGQVENVATFDQLETMAGHRLKLVESQFFRSPERGRVLLRGIESAILFAPPIVLLLVLTILLVRKRVQSVAVS